MGNPEENKIEEKKTETVEAVSAGKNSSVNDLPEEIKTFENREVKAPKKRKYGWIGNVALLAVIALSLWMMFEIISGHSDEVASFGDVISSASIKFAVITLAVLLAIMFCDCMKYATVLKTTTGKFHIREAVKVAFLGKYYDNVTPFAAGGQPIQIYYLHKKGFSGGTSSAVILIKYFVQMCCWVSVSLGFMIFGLCTGLLDGLSVAQRALILTGSWIGIGVNLFLPASVILFTVLPKFARKLASLLIGLGFKLKIVKDKEKTMQNAERVLTDFRNGFKIMAKKPLALIALIAFCLFDVFFTFAFPFFAIKTLSGLEGESFSIIFSVTAMNIFVAQSVAVIPTPGNTGAMEGVGALAFSLFIVGGVQFWAMFLWRFCVYYIYIIVGLGLTVFDFIRRLVRQGRVKRSEKSATEQVVENGEEQSSETSADAGENAD